VKFVLVTFRKPDLSKKEARYREDGYQYPKPFDAREVHVHGTGPVYDLETMFDTASGRAECLIRITNAIADRYAQSPYMSILTALEADAWVDANQTVQNASEYDVDEPIVNALNLRLAAGRTLDTLELEMLDPDNRRAGIRRVRRTKEALLKIRPSGRGGP